MYSTRFTATVQRPPTRITEKGSQENSSESEQNSKTVVDFKNVSLNNDSESEDEFVNIVVPLFERGDSEIKEVLSRSTEVRQRAEKKLKAKQGLFWTIYYLSKFSVSNLTPCTCWSAVLSHAAVITVYRNLEPRSNGFEIVPIPLHTWSFCRYVALLSTEREEERPGAVLRDDTKNSCVQY